MPKSHKPRSGSKQFIPHRRAKKKAGKIRAWPSSEGVLGFAGYKAGMIHYTYQDTNPKSAHKGKTLTAPGTVVEVPPLKVVGVKVYKKATHGYNSIGVAKNKGELEKLKGDLLRLLVQTQPALAGLPKKNGELFELPVGGDFESQLAIAKEKLGSELTLSDIFNDGDLVDVTSVTRGQGFQGPVKKFGLKVFREKMEKSYRKPGHIGSGMTPTRVPWYAPMGGKIGYHQRTELNKRIVSINNGLDKKEFPRYGLVGDNYLILSGSVPGPRKRLIRMKPAIRPPAKSRAKPEILQIVR